MTKPPIIVTVTWTDAQHDNTFECAVAEVGERVQLMYGRTHTGHLVHVDEEKLVIAFGYDPPTAHHDTNTAVVSEFLAIPLGWITQVKRVHGQVLFSPTLPKVRKRKKR